MSQDYHIVVSNPTGADVISAGEHTAPAWSVSVQHINSASPQHYKDFLEGGCSIGPYDGGTMLERQNGGFLLYMLQVEQEV